jgi:hypothetical protein
MMLADCELAVAYDMTRLFALPEREVLAASSVHSFGN